MHFSEGKVMVTSCQKRSADQAPNGINGGGVACLSPAPPTKSLDLSLTLTNNVIHVNDVPEHLLTMYPVCTLPRVRHWMSMEREQAHKKGGNKHKGLERLPDAQRRTRRSASLPRHTRGLAAHIRIAPHAHLYSRANFAIKSYGYGACSSLAASSFAT